MSNFINIIGFSNYYALLGLALTPVIWIIVKSLPPVPKSFNFSSFFLLEKIDHDNSKNKKTPLWLVLFRTFLFILIVFFFSKPFLKNENSITGEKFEKYIIVADIGWSIAKDWDKFKEIVLAIGKEAEKNKKKIVFFHSKLVSYKEARIFNTSDYLNNYLENISPLPVQLKSSSLNKLIKKDNFFKNSQVFFISSKFDFINFADQFKSINNLKNRNNNYHFINPVETILIIKSIKITQDKIKCEIFRLGKNKFKQDFFLKIETVNKEVIYRNAHTIKKNKNIEIINLSFPIEIINQIESIRLVGQNHAGAKYYFDDFSKKKNIAILTNNEFYNQSPLLSPIYYIKKSLHPKHTIKIEKIENIINQDYSTIIIPGKIKIPNELNDRLNKWLLEGGTLIRFAEEGMVGKYSSFLPYQETYSRIRYIDSQLTINNKLIISAFEKDSIFYGIEIPRDINFNKQLIFEVNSEQVNILAKLNDNTPLVSMKKFGDGEIILFHIGANNDWSNLPISSLFSDILNRVLLFSKNSKSYNLNNLNLNKEIDGFGNLITPKRIVSIDNFEKLKTLKPSIENPPGKYENNQISIFLNLATNITDYTTEKNNSIVDTSYSFETSRDLSPTILKIILSMFILDILITIMIKNNVSYLRIFARKKGLLVFIIFFLACIKIDNVIANQTYLAYIKINNNQINKVSAIGLENIRNLLETRTSINAKGVIGLDIKSDNIFSYPFIYWPLTRNLLDIKKPEIIKIKNYLNNGGIIVFDVIEFSRDTFNLKEKKFQILGIFCMI